MSGNVLKNVVWSLWFHKPHQGIVGWLEVKNIMYCALIDNANVQLNYLFQLDAHHAMLSNTS